MHRERGLHLDEPDVTIDGQPVPAAILGTALTLFYAGRAQAERGQGIYFYLPKLESAAEAAFWYRDLFDASRERCRSCSGATIRGIPLVESLPRRLPDGGDALRARARTRPGSTPRAGTSRPASSSSS